jgi:hypothetical protein
VSSFFVLSPTIIFRLTHSATLESRAGYTSGGRIFVVAVVGRSLSIDLLLPGRWTSVPESDSDGAIVEAIDIIEAIEKVLEWSAPLVEEAILAVRV